MMIVHGITLVPMVWMIKKEDSVTKAEAWEIVSGIVDDIDAEDMTRLIERLDVLLQEQIDAENKLNKAEE